MASHPANLFIRFVLEIFALVAMGRWAAERVEGRLAWLFALSVPLAAAVIWGVFNVPGDPSRSGHAPVPVPGAVRLLIEFAFFGFAAWTTFQVFPLLYPIVFSALLVAHYLASYDRIAWLLGASSGKT